MEHNFAFIYAKDGKIRVLTLQQATRLKWELEGEGWKHTQTLDPNTFLEYLHNNCDEDLILEEIYALAEYPNEHNENT